MLSPQRRVSSWKSALLGAAAVGSLFTAAIAQDRPQIEPSDGVDFEQVESFVPTGLLADEGENLSPSRVIACYAEGTDPDYVDQIDRQVDAINAALLGPRYQLTGRWTGAQGDPRTLTWSFAPDGLSIPDGIGEGVSNNTLFATMDARFGGMANRAVWISRFQAVFDRWQSLNGVTYQRITVGGNDWDDGASWTSLGAAGLRGDIRICAKFMDGANGVLAYNFFPGAGGTAGNMHLDNGENWGSSTNTHRFLRNTAAHEHGHGIGLLHVCPIANNKLMEPFLATNFDGPQHDDIRGGQRHYGDPREELNDNTSAGTSDVSTTVNTTGGFSAPVPLATGVTYSPCTLPAPVLGNTSDCSIDANGEVDFFRFTVAAGGTVDITVTPLGQSYVDCPQSGNCNCTSPITNSLIAANLAVDLIATNGTTVLATASANGAGLAETIAGGGLGGAGTYFIRVSEVDAPAQTQLYSMTVRYLQGGCLGASIVMQPTNQIGCPGGSVSFSVATNGTGPITYEWRRGVTPLVNGGNISGQGTPTLTINPAGAGDVATDYNCFVSNTCGSATSSNASLSLNAATSITTQPPNRTVCAGGLTTFTVVAGGTGPFTYQWRRGTTNLSDTGNLFGSNTATLTIGPIGVGDAATNYNCVVTGACGSATTLDRSLTVRTLPAITGQPANQSASVGGSASFSVTASGTAPLSYQWRRGTTPLSNGGNISGADTATLTINPVAAGDAGNDYNCDVSNVCDEAVSNNATLTVTSNPCPGDLNGDQVVDITDLATLLAHFGTASGATAADGDMDGNGTVDLSDLSMMLARFGATC